MSLLPVALKGSWSCVGGCGLGIESRILSHDLVSLLRGLIGDLVERWSGVVGALQLADVLLVLHVLLGELTDGLGPRVNAGWLRKGSWRRGSSTGCMQRSRRWQCSRWWQRARRWVPIVRRHILLLPFEPITHQRSLQSELPILTSELSIVVFLCTSLSSLSPINCILFWWPLE